MAEALEELPAYACAQPKWLTELLAWSRNHLPKPKNDAILKEQLKCVNATLQGIKVGEARVLQIPCSWLDFGKYSFPGSWPLKGSIKALAETHYPEGIAETMRLPPAGHSLEIAICSDSLTAADIGKLERWN